MNAAGLRVAKEQAAMKIDGQDVADAVGSTRAEKWANPITAPATSTTITVLYSISFPVWNVLSQ